MEVNRKRTQVHRLPTENCENSKFGYIKRSGALHYFTDGLDPYHHLDNLAVPQHLYITSDEEIKEGDWAYSPVSKEVKQVVKILPHKRGSMLCYQGEDVILSNEEKIIATTDPKLRNDIPTLNTMGERTVYPQLLPRLSQDFIEEYCKAGGIDEVDVEYELQSLQIHSKRSGVESWEQRDVLKLKVDPIHNTITTHRIVEKMYSRDDMKKMWIHLGEQGWGDSSGEGFDKWIKENL